MRNPKVWISTLALFALAGAGCTHFTQVATEPVGARVFINGQRICSETPCLWESKVGLPRRFHLQIQKQGYKEVDLYVDREVWLLPYLVGFLFQSYGGTVIMAVSNRTPELLSFQLESNGEPIQTPAPPPGYPPQGYPPPGYPPPGYPPQGYPPQGYPPQGYPPQYPPPGYPPQGYPPQYPPPGYPPQGYPPSQGAPPPPASPAPAAPDAQPNRTE